MSDGRGILCATLDVQEDGEENFIEWHTREHMVERVGLEGFMRGRRFFRQSGSPKYLILYDVADLSVLSSPEYIARLDDPTPWTRGTLGTFRNGIRSAYRVDFSRGLVEGGFVLMLRFAPTVPEKARRDLDDVALESFLAKAGITCVCLALPDRHSSTIDTVESRQSGNVFREEWLLLVEGTSERSLTDLVKAELSVDRIRSWGMKDDFTVGVYQMQARAGRGAAW